MSSIAALDPLALTAAFAAARDPLVEAIADQGDPGPLLSLVTTCVAPTIEAAVAGWELALRPGALPEAMQRALLRRAGVPAAEPTRQEALLRAAETAALAAMGRQALYLPVVERTAGSLLSVWMGLAPRLDPEWISWPLGQPSYRDLPAPRTPAEAIERGESLISAAWSIVGGVNGPRAALRPLIALMDVAAAVDRRGLGPWPGLIVRS
jgi:hypothetical protein